jgi:AcrR family transcriptional regulator
LIDLLVNEKYDGKMSPRNKKANQQILDERRKQILLAALKIFARHGFAATRISDIAFAAGLSHGLIYHYFSSKDEIFTELAEHAFSGAHGVFEYGSKLNTSPLEKIRVITEMTISGAYQGDGAYYWNIVLQAYISEAIPKKLKKLAIKTISSYNDLLVPIILEGQKLGQVVKDDPIKLATTFYSMVNGMGVLQMMAKELPDNIVSLPDAEMVMRVFKKY